jgi:hypothetical protein
MPSELALLTYGRKIRSVERDLDARQLATRIFPRGGDEDGFHFTMADHRWEVAAVDGPWVTLAPDADGPPIRFPDQLNGLLATKYPTSAAWRVIATDEVGQRVELEDVPDTLEAGDHVQFRQGGICQPTAGDLVYLDRPPALATYAGIWEGVHDRVDIPPVNNLAPNPWFEEWITTFNHPNGRPVDWSNRQGFIISPFEQVSAEAFRRFGHYSVGVGFGGFNPFAGIESSWIDVHPTAARPYFSVQASFFIVSGVVALELVLDLAGDGSTTITVPDPALPVVEEPRGRADVRSNEFRKAGIWTEAGIGGLDFWDDPEWGAVQRVRIRLRRGAADEAARFYLDAVQFTQEHAGVGVWHDRLASNALWHAANDALEHRGEPLATYSVRPLDLFREDPAAFRHDELVRGSRVRVRDVPLGIDVTTRIEEISRDLTETGQVVTAIELANQSPALTRQLQRTPRPRTEIEAREAVGGPDDEDTGGALSGLRVTLIEDGTGSGPDLEVLEWAHNQVIEEDVASRFHLEIRSTIEGLVADDVDPKDEDGFAAATPRYGAYQVPVQLGFEGTDAWRVNVYTVQLYDGAVLAATYQTSRGAYYHVES